MIRLSLTALRHSASSRLSSSRESSSCRLVVRVILLIISLILPASVYAAGNDELESKSSAELLGRASSYIEADTLLDKAVASLSVITNRYYAKPEDSTARRDAITAMYQLGNIYSLRLFDFPKAFTNLSTARMLAEEEGDDYDLSLILLRLANIYNICYDNTEQKATHAMLSEALDRAIASNNEEVITRLAVNFSILQILEKGWGAHAKEISRIRAYRFPAKSNYRLVYVNIVDGMNAYFRGDYAAAEKHFKKVIADLPADLQFRERYVYGAMYLLQYVYENKGDYVAEEKLLRERLKYVKALNLDDYILYTYSHLVHFFDRRHQPDSVKKYTYLYLLKKEEMNQNTGLNKVKNVDMLRQIEKANDEVRELSLKRIKERRRLIVVISISVVVFIILLGVVYLFLNLRRNHKLLFQKNRELLDREEQLRMLIAHKNAESAEGAQHPPDKEDSGGDCEADEESTLLFPRILKVMEEDSSIYSLGFGIDSLAGILHVPQRSVSKAINACSGTNFHQFLNGYRIREACRLMQTTDPTSTTVEYIAETVGFKSRTSFASLFKKTTGLTPSEYWKMAHKEPREPRNTESDTP